MTRHTIGAALVVLGTVLLVLPAFFPVQPTLIHDTRPNTFDGPAEFAQEGIEVIHYESLSERGQELYVRTLESGGEYHVAPGEGAPDFEYLTSNERTEAFEEGQNERPGVVVIERPDDADLPPADEPFGRTAPDEEVSDRQQQTNRYDMMETATEPPGLGSVPQLLRLGAALIAILSLGVGGYLRAQP
jgi:hypothetical protein